MVRSHAPRTTSSCGRAPAVQYTSPAVLFVPLDQGLLEDDEFDPFEMADDVGAAPGEVAWLISESSALETPDLVGRRIHHIRDRGFQVALADVAPGVLGRGPLGDLMPNFVFLDESYAEFLTTGVRGAR